MLFNKEQCHPDQNEDRAPDRNVNISLKYGNQKYTNGQKGKGRQGHYHGCFLQVLKHKIVGPKLRLTL
ncbi:MAG: hypothetical protein ACD_23C00564G0001 [uncultured bacterium]|nr:MAG: hypothetical protein ACD_23C00564G0001 [uncultured bacterium]